MFARQSGLSGNAGGSNLVEFRAGRMNMIGKMVHPDTRKGLVYLTQSEDGLMHFCWKDRTSGKVEDDLIVFPDDFEFKRVEQCKTGRVFVLKFKSSSRRMFFWMQEPKTEKDEEFCRRVNELMNNPPSAQRGGNDSGDLQYMLNNMSQQQLMQLFGGVGQMGGLSSLLGSINRNSDSSSRTANLSSRSGNTNSSASLSTPESNSAPRTPGAPRSRIGSRIQFNPTTTEESNTTGNKSSSGGTTAGATSGTDAVQIDLSAGIAATEAINVVTADPDKVNQLAVLLPQTEDSEDKKKQIKDTIASPQFQQALSIFSNALQTAQLGPVVSHFELTPEAVTAAYAGNLEDFIKALEKALPAGASMETSKDETTPQKMEHSGEDETKSEKQDKS